MWLWYYRGYSRIQTYMYSVVKQKIKFFFFKKKKIFLNITIVGKIYWYIPTYMYVCILLAEKYKIYMYIFNFRCVINYNSCNTLKRKINRMNILRKHRAIIIELHAKIHILQNSIELLNVF